MPEGSSDIGNFYKALGGITLVGAVILLGMAIKFEHELTTVDGFLVGGLIIAGLALLRPDKLGEWIKDFADWLPFVNYRKPPDA